MLSNLLALKFSAVFSNAFCIEKTAEISEQVNTIVKQRGGAQSFYHSLSLSIIRKNARNVIYPVPTQHFHFVISNEIYIMHSNKLLFNQSNHVRCDKVPLYTYNSNQSTCVPTHRLQIVDNSFRTKILVSTHWIIIK